MRLVCHFISQSAMMNDIKNNTGIKYDIRVTTDKFQELKHFRNLQI